MKTALFRQFSDIAYARAGIRLADGKEALVDARVAKRLRALGLTDAGEYLQVLNDDTSGEELVSFLDVITTNFTRFFREPDHFTELKDILRAWYQEGQRRFRIWSAASSTGEEPYTIAMTVLDAFDGRSVDVRILATDISTRVLNRAREGVYTEAGVAPVEPRLRARYLQKVPGPGGDGRSYRVTDAVRDLVTFRRLNLSEPPFPMQGPLDIVFCRNVMIYFDTAVRQRLISEIERLSRPDGVLFIGHTETLTGIATGFSSSRPSVYWKGRRAASRQELGR